MLCLIFVIKLNEDDNIKLCDFGLSNILESDGKFANLSGALVELFIS